MASDKRRVLVLYVDRDNDVGKATRVKTPIIGQEANLKAAMEFITREPEDADANAMFAALQVYKNLLSDDRYICEIATIAGLGGRGVEADIKVASELDEVLKGFPADSVILVSDGVSDEQVLPIVQSKVPIASVRRVVVKQSRGIEEAYFLLTKYLRLVVEDPRYSPFFLGIPGVFMIALAVLIILNLVSYAGIALMLIAGSTMVIKGFRIDERAVRAWSKSPIMFFSSFIALLTFVIALYLGAGAVISQVKLKPEYLSLSNVPRLLGTFLALTGREAFPFKVYSSDIIMVGVIILVVGKGVEKYVNGIPKIWHEVVTLVFCLMFIVVLREVAALLNNPTLNPIAFLTWMLLTSLTCASLILTFIVYERLIKRDQEGRGG